MVNTGTAPSQDWVDIYAVIVRYARALDARDYALFQTCFVPTAKIRYVTPGMNSDITFDDPAQAAEGLRKIHAPLDATLHRVSNHTIVVDCDRGAGRTYVDVLEVRTETSGLASTILNHIGYYDDEFSRADGTWRISSRTFYGVYSGGDKGIIELPS